MSVEIVYRVVKANGELAGEYMDKKLADAHDQKLDCIYTLVELMREQAKDLEESVAEGIAEHLVDNKTVLLSALKKVKDVPAESNSNIKNQQSADAKVDGESSNDESNVELLDSNKKVANG